MPSERQRSGLLFTDSRTDFESVPKNGLKPAPFVPLLLSTARNTGSFFFFFNNLKSVSHVRQGFSEQLRWKLP